MKHFDAGARRWDEDPMKQARARAVAAAIRKYLPAKRALRALEYGAGTGLLSFALIDDLAAITLADVSDGMLTVAREKISDRAAAHMDVLKLDLTQEPLPSERWDVIYSLMTLHHIPDTADILRRWYALLNPGGRLFICDLDKEDGSFHRYDFQGHYGFERDVLANLAAQAGFRRVSFETPYTIHRDDKNYPLFLLIAEKEISEE